jgi:hypothetical protein
MKSINWKFWAGLALAALILYAVIKFPVTSAANVHAGVGKLGEGADRVGMFFGSLLGGK